MSLQPPLVPSVPSGPRRPLWSVMIPTYNCAGYLRQTLASVLAQDPGVDAMQIEVVDDCSTKDDPAAVVQELGRGRVAFHRKPQNGGVTANFNTCLARSRGELVHVLHGDDFVLPGFYATIGAAAARHADAALFATRVFFTDEQGIYTGISPRLPALEEPSRDAHDFFYETPVQFAGVVVRRSFYESAGGFRPDLVHVTDREMWIRAITRQGGVVRPEVLAAYRVFDGNDTAAQKQRAENLRDRERLNHQLEQADPRFAGALARQRLLDDALGQYWRFTALKHAAAAEANLQFWSDRARLRDRVRFALSRLRRLIARQP